MCVWSALLLSSLGANLHEGGQIAEVIGHRVREGRKIEGISGIYGGIKECL